MSDRKEFEDWFFSPSNSMSMSDIDVAWDAWQVSAQRTQASWTDDQMISFAAMILMQGPHSDSIEMRLQSFRRLETLRGNTTPAQQPAQATQAEVTDGIPPEDFTVDVVVKPMGGFAPVNTKGVRVTHKPTGVSVTCDVARSQHANRNQAFEKLSAILALQKNNFSHERVPMTREQAMAIVQSNPDTMTAIRMTEAHHGITA